MPLTRLNGTVHRQLQLFLPVYNGLVTLTVTSLELAVYHVYISFNLVEFLGWGI
jgi:hypothetical protein